MCSSSYNVEYLDCSECGKYVKSGKKVASICCDTCNCWVHRKCSGLNKVNFDRLQNNDDKLTIVTHHCGF